MELEITLTEQSHGNAIALLMGNDDVEVKSVERGAFSEAVVSLEFEPDEEREVGDRTYGDKALTKGGIEILIDSGGEHVTTRVISKNRLEYERDDG